VTDATAWLGLPAAFSDTEVTVGRVPGELSPNARRGVMWQAEPGRLLLRVPGVAAFLVESGSQITVDPVAGGSDEAVTRLARMTPLAALACQRGLVALHAATAVGPAGAIVLVGQSGAGKSTLLTALLANGWDLLSDEVSIIDANARAGPVVLPGTGELTLWSDAVKQFAADASDAGPPDSQGRQILRRDGRLLDSPQPLQTIYLLSTGPGPEVQHVEHRGAAALRRLGSNEYNTQIIDALVRPADHLRSLARLARYPVHELRRPRSAWSIDALVSRLQNAEVP
jgi:hypothetical protein